MSVVSLSSSGVRLSPRESSIPIEQYGNGIIFSSHRPVLEVLDFMRTNGIRVNVMLGSYKGVKEVSYAVAATTGVVAKLREFISDQESILVADQSANGYIVYLKDGVPVTSEHIGKLHWMKPGKEQLPQDYTYDLSNAEYFEAK